MGSSQAGARSLSRPSTSRATNATTMTAMVTALTGSMFGSNSVGASEVSTSSSW